MTTTTIIVYTSGPAAVLSACAAGWHRLDLDLSSWTTVERERLAEAIVDTDRGPKLLARSGYTRLLEGAPRTGIVETIQHAPYDRREYAAILVAPATAERLREIVQASLATTAAREQSERDEQAQRKAAEIAEAERRHAELMTAPIDALVLEIYGEWRVRSDVPEDREPEAIAEARRRNDESARAKAEAQAEQERHAAADRAKLREILLTVADDLLPVYDAGMARAEDLDEALVEWTCDQLGVDPADLTDHVYVRELEQVDPTHYRALMRTRNAASKLGDSLDGIVAARGAASRDESYDDNEAELLVLVRGAIAGRQVYLEIPIEHTPLGE